MTAGRGRSWTRDDTPPKKPTSAELKAAKEKQKDANTKKGDDTIYLGK